MELIHFLCSQAEFGYGNGGILGEAEIMDLVIADADAVGDFVPVVVSVEAVAALGLLAVVQLAVAAS